MAKDWVRLPSKWINDKGLGEFSWKHGGEGSDQIAALMDLTVIAHAADQETGVARVTYDECCNFTDLSRAKVSRGLDVLENLKLIEREPDGARSIIKLANYDASTGWAKFPAKSMYSAGRIAAFAECRLRRVVELDALKIFFLMVARRNRKTNIANIGYDKIEEYADIRRVRIKSAISFLASLSLVYVERIPSMESEHGVSNAYRVVGIDTFNHMGTMGRGLDGLDFAGNAELPDYQEHL